MSLPQLKILRTYAKMDDASIAAKKLPPTVYFSHTRHTLTIFDAYPKALFHFLVLPRLRTTAATSTITDGGGENDSSREGEGDDGDGDGDGDGGERTRGESESAISLATSEAVLTSLRTLIQSAIITSPSSPPNADEEEEEEKRARAKATLRVLADEATRLRSEIEREMRARYGFAWPIWVGFHAVPSMEHLHLHVISSDLTASALKTKRHYNTFSPRVGFFIPLTKVRAWFEEDTNEKTNGDGDQQQQLLRMATRLAPEKYEPRLKDALVCFHCGETAKNMPALKKHLQDEFDALRKREVGKLKRKREAESAMSDGGG